MRVFTSDFETTTWSKGNPYDQRNFAVCLGYKVDDEPTRCDFLDGWYLTGEDYHSALWVFFNAKYDVAWYRKSMPSMFSAIGNVWCCQLAEFVLDGQTKPYPSLEETAVKYGLGHKIDVIKEQYWSKGINTDAIPRDLLAEYCIQDVDLTYKVYQRQVEEFKKFPEAMLKAFKLRCMDLLILQEMEWNGLIYDEAMCESKSKELAGEIQEIYTTLGRVYPDVPINFNSGDQLSAFLYGGIVKQESKEHIGFFKTGAKTGQPKYKNVEIEHVLPRLVTPLPKSELQKEGVYKTSEDILRKLKGKPAKLYVPLLLRLSELEKLNSTYYRGLPEKNKEMCWKSGEIHGQFNQCVAATGRLSSSQPNLQNFATDCQDIFVSRFND